MRQYRIFIPETLKTDAIGYTFLSQMYSAISCQDSKEVYIDFSQCLHFDTNLTAVMGAIFDNLSDRGFKIFLYGINKDSDVLVSLSRNKFLPLSIDSEGNLPIENENIVPYTRFSTDAHEQFKEYIDNELIHKKRFPEHSQRVGKAIQENIYEIYVNAITHGRCGDVYSSGDFIPSETANPQLLMTIADLGSTIVNNVNSYRMGRNEMPYELDCDAIEWAMGKGHTTKNEPGGLGLSLLMEFIEKNEGAFHIVSGRGLVRFENGNLMKETLQASFPGTIVNMTFNFGDEKCYFMSDEPIDYNNIL